MCGIVGFSGCGDIRRIIAGALGALQYRGYDACGCAVWRGREFDVRKEVGPDSLVRLTASLPSCRGVFSCLGHTRWATHGANTIENAHPHLDCTGRIAVVHNGVVENYEQIKASLVSRGHIFRSQTDTEAVPHLIEEYLRLMPLREAVRRALADIEGRFAIALLAGGRAMAAGRRGLPLIVAMEGRNIWVTSDPAAVPDRAVTQIVLEDGELFLSEGDVHAVVDIATGRQRELRIEPLAADRRATLRGAYAHYMLKEIHEQPRAVADTVIRFDRHLAEEFLDPVVRGEGRLFLVGCGTSWHAALVGRYMIEAEARLPVEVDYASEFRYRRPVLRSRDVVVAISQSGETADTIAALELAREHGCPVGSICNVPGSSIGRMSDAAFRTFAGPEVGVASTKAFTAQLAVLRLLSLSLGRLRGFLDESSQHREVEELLETTTKMDAVLQEEESVSSLARRYADRTNVLYLGRGAQFPIALEGALKLKEVSYIHAEGYPAAEMKHGPLALVDRSLPVVSIAVDDGHYRKMLSNIEEVRARGGEVICVSDRSPASISSQMLVRVPHTGPFLMAFLTVIPLQLFAYHAAVARGCEVDRPRHLAKSVTVE